VEHETSQVVQTAWALRALLLARDPDFVALERAARFLASSQREDGTWPEQDPSAIFADGSLVEYRLHRAYYPLLALALYEERARARSASAGEKPKKKPGSPERTLLG
jgi:lanosterol synthase